MVTGLTDRVAIVTGGGSGLGRGSVLALAAAGASVGIADIDGQRADTVAAEVLAVGGTAVGVRCDVTSQSDFHRLRDVVLDRFGRVDVVMNNVGALAFGAPHEIPIEEWQRSIDINLLAIVRSNAVFVPLMIEQRSGHIVNTASTSGLWAYSYDRTPYLATKFAVVGLSEALALYLRPRGIGVTCLCPGGIDGGAISTWARVYGDEPRLAYNPGISRLGALDVGEMVVDAILTNRFFVPTSPEVPQILVERAGDPDAFLAKTIAGIERGSGQGASRTSRS